MKKCMTLLTILCICFSLCACGAENEPAASLNPNVPQKGAPLYESLNSEHMKNILSDMPTEIIIRIDRSGGEFIADVTDEETIGQLVDLFSKATIGERTYEEVTDNYNGIAFVFSDGEEASISLNLKNLEISVDGERYLFILDNFDEFWQLASKLAE